MTDPGNLTLRRAGRADVPALVALERRAFSADYFNRRQIHWLVTRGNAAVLVAEEDGKLAGYAMLLFHRGTSLGRLYSIAVDPAWRGRGVGDFLLREVERCAEEHDCVALRLEVRPDNAPAIALYRRHGYREFGRFPDYYEDHTEALRMQKRILRRPEQVGLPVPFYAQTTQFSCGPAVLMMAMKAINPMLELSRTLELQLWREATTIYMTAGHGGCSPQGLALAAARRGYQVSLYLNSLEPLFTEGVRSEDKKNVLRVVHDDFMQQLRLSKVTLHHTWVDTETLVAALAAGQLPLVLISTFRFHRSKAPHWVLISGADDTFVYLHDPELDPEEWREEADCIYLPVRREDFDRMFRFGQAQLRAAVVIGKYDSDRASTKSRGGQRRGPRGGRV